MHHAPKRPVGYLTSPTVVQMVLEFSGVPVEYLLAAEPNGARLQLGPKAKDTGC
jgi:hypothetical protein